jgi:N-acetylmuramoyl-L-alanine amidase
MRKINEIVLHCSVSNFGGAVIIDKWHRQRGWPLIGYHFVIRYSKNELFDGGIEIGRPVEKMGAHVYGHNTDSIGICLIGKPDPETGKCKFSQAQLLSARKLCLHLMEKYDVGVENILGHYELDNNKTCPAMDMDLFRACMGSNKIDEFADLLGSMV